jgi:DNA-binding phage protein
MPGNTERLVGEVAAASGRADAAAQAAERARITRNAAMLRAHSGKVSYRQLQAATGLTRTGVYKALEDAAGGSLRVDSTPDVPVG